MAGWPGEAHRGPVWPDWAAQAHVAGPGTPPVKLRLLPVCRAHGPGRRQADLCQGRSLPYQNQGLLDPLHAAGRELSEVQEEPESRQGFPQPAGLFPLNLSPQGTADKDVVE